MAGETRFVVFLDRSSFLGRCRAVGGMSGDPGSFFTMIFGPPLFRDALGGEDLWALAAAPTLLGLPLPVRADDAGAFGAAEEVGGGRAADVLCEVGDVVMGGSSVPKDGLS